MTTRTSDGTSRRLYLLVGLVVAAGFGITVNAIIWITLRPAETGFLYPIVLTGLIWAANSSGFQVRIRANTIRFCGLSSAMLVAAAVEPLQWVVVCTTIGVLASNLTSRLAPMKVAYNVSKETLAAAAAAGTLAALGAPPTRPAALMDHFEHRLWVMLIVVIVYMIIDESLGLMVIALATRTSIRQHFRTHLDVRLLLRLAAFVVALAMLVVVAVDKWLLAAMPPLLFALHLAAKNQVRSREEREAWQRLARTTDELNAVDLDSVLTSAVIRAAELFSADEIEVQLPPSTVAGPRLVRGTSDGVQYDGPPEEAPKASGVVIPFSLLSPDDGPDVGELRLRFRGKVQLTEREEYTFHTFAAALCTAIRNATAYAETQRLAESNALAAAQDPLTRLANRRRLYEYGTEVLARRPARGITGLLLVDLNHFKEVNDTLGHSAGDKVLVEVADRLATAAQPDDLVARLGGDEFAVLFVGLPAPAVAMHRAQQVLESLAPPVELDGMRITVEASAGVATAASRGGVVELLRRADVAMYQAKRDGQRISAYARARDTADVGSLALGGDLARAVAEDQFTVNFQPIVDLGTGEVIAAEALTRWQHPNRGDLPPKRFLEAIERSGRLPAFAQAVLDQALNAVAGWREAGFVMPVAVNVSPRSLLDPAFPIMVIERLAAHDLPAEALVVELTESLTLSQLDVVDHVLGALRQEGVQLALDDFGTGYSSLATLARVPVHELKIDQSFVAALDSPVAAAVVRSTIDLGRSLDLLVVAEGVESEEQRARLWELGCPAGQGHLFARPMPAARLLDALERGNDGRRGALAPILHEAGSVIRIPAGRRGRPATQRLDRSG
jgi:diguanylate cyclase (GGDEF)-like protein